MLRHHHNRYEHLHVYYLDLLQLPPIEHPDLIGIWGEDDKAILFFHTSQDRLVRDICNRSGAQVIYRADLDYRDWEAGVTIASFTTKNLSVRPVWEERASAPGEKERPEIILDPSVVFGSGFHPTTRSCLETLELLMLESGCSIRSVADLGTGTGLLGIAAAKLGAEHVAAYDNNPLACEVAQNNIVRNNCSSQVSVTKQDLSKALPDLGEFDLVVANLYKDLLIRFFVEPGFWKADMYIISGIIPAMEENLLAAMPKNGVRFLHRRKNEIWRLWVLRTHSGKEVSW